MSAAQNTDKTTAEQQKLAYYEASQWTLVRRRFSKHLVARWMLFLVIILYVLCLNAGFKQAFFQRVLHPAAAAGYAARTQSDLNLTFIIRFGFLTI